jgi:hypothetical protein
MRWKIRSKWIKVDRRWMIPKHRWFAWYPVFVKNRGEYVWLEYVVREGHDGDGYGDWWEYEAE